MNQNGFESDREEQACLESLAWRNAQEEEQREMYERELAEETDRASEYIKRGDAMRATLRGEQSDGYHTFNELYRHRAVLFSVVVSRFSNLAWKSRLHHDGTMYGGMFIVGIDTADGPATYHYDIDPYWDMFKCKALDRAPTWDGHTPEQAIARIGTLAAAPPNLPRPLTDILELHELSAVWMVMLDGYTSLHSAGSLKMCIKTGSYSMEELSRNMYFTSLPTPADIEAARREHVTKDEYNVDENGQWYITEERINW